MKDTQDDKKIDVAEPECEMGQRVVVSNKKKITSAHRRKDFCTNIMVLPALVLALIGLVAFDVIMETNITSRVPAAILTSHEICTPKVLKSSTIEYHSEHAYYTELKDVTVPMPVFRDKHTTLCGKKIRREAKYNYCVPISGRKDALFCAAADRMDLLNLHSSKSICYASVLHMLMVEVYEELQATENIPFLAFGSLLGAVRNGSMIPFTEDVDIGVVGELVTPDAFRLALRKKGYHMLFMDIWRVCGADTSIGRPSLRPEFASCRELRCAEFKGSNGHILPGKKVQPFSQVKINGMSFDTVKDPKFFLKEDYGYDYMTPM